MKTITLNPTFADTVIAADLFTLYALVAVAGAAYFVRQALK